MATTAAEAGATLVAESAALDGPFNPDKVQPLPGSPAATVRAICNVMAALPAIGKAERSPEGYNYRGIESITKHAQMLMAREGLVIVPTKVTITSVELSPNMREGWQDTYVSVEWAIYGPDGSCIPAGTVGIGRDKADKGSNKGQTQAFKYLLLSIFCVADKADDSDGQTYEHDRAEATQRNTTKAKGKGKGTQAPADEAPAQQASDVDWQSLGWQSKAEHDSARDAATARIKEHEDAGLPGFVDHMRAEWRERGLRLPFTFDQMSEWGSLIESQVVSFANGMDAAGAPGGDGTPDPEPVMGQDEAIPQQPARAQVGARAKRAHEGQA